MQSALDELENAVTTTENFLNQGEQTAASVRSHMLTLEEATSSVELQQKSLELQIEARRMRRRLEQLQVELDSQSPLAVSSQSSNQTTAASAVDPETGREGKKLPALMVPSFDGDASRYSAYRNMLMERVINQPTMTASSKWARLRNSLSGPPAELISDIPQLPELLKVALKVLDDAYGSNAKLIEKLYHKFVNLPSSSSATESIRMTHAKLESILLSMTELGYPINGCPSICSTYVEKFPRDVFNEAFKTEVTDLQTIREGIAKLIIDRTALQEIMISPLARAWRT